MKKYIIKNLDDLKEFALFFLKNIETKKKDMQNAKLILLNGDLGVGKTAFVKKIGEILSIKESILSPTFIISKEYKIPKNNLVKYKKLIHIDAYRLNLNDFKNINLNNQINDPNNIIFIEWSDIFKEKLPKNSILLNFKYKNNTQRCIEC